MTQQEFREICRSFFAPITETSSKISTIVETGLSVRFEKKVAYILLGYDRDLYYRDEFDLTVWLVARDGSLVKT